MRLAPDFLINLPNAPPFCYCKKDPTLVPSGVPSNRGGAILKGLTTAGRPNSPFFSCDRFFELALTRSGYELVTDPIPFDAVALGSDELPAVSTTDSLVTCENDAGNNDDECPDSRLENSGSLQMKVCIRTEPKMSEKAWQTKSST